jgi:hypothetical protein
LYKLTWKDSTTPSLRRVSLLRASVRRTSDNDCGSSQTLPQAAWPTPNSGPQNLGDTTWERRREELKAEHKNGNGFGLNLGQAATLAGWTTTTTRDWKDSGADIKPREDGTERFDQLPRQANLAGWPSPTVGNATGSQSMANMSATGRREDGSKGTVSLPGVGKLAGWPTPVTVPDSDASHGQLSGDLRPGPTNGHWRNADWLHCRDGKWRPVEPGTFPLAHGAAARVGRLRAYGNAIVPQVAAEVISAYMLG